MIELSNIAKEYSTKNAPNIKALCNISCSLPNKGLVFILGESGSGKTTLMNIIGGLDIPTGGDLIFLDKVIGKKEKELDEYRNKYVGFVFQDYNIIPELNIRDNLTMGLNFQDLSITNEFIDRTLSSVMLKGYEKRYPNELSGGQLQRVAIARALIKKSKVLLADEPTGNLDKKTGNEIIKLLKEISKEKLVIIVTHNEELANNYGDRLIKLEDGSIIFDEIKTITPPNSKEVYETGESKRFSNRIAFKMGLKNLSFKKIKLIVTVLLMMISYASIALTMSFFSYHHADPHTKLIKTRDYDYFSLSNVSYHDIQNIKQKNTTTKILEDFKVGSKQEMIDFGFEMYPESLEITENSYYISESLLYRFFDMGEIALIEDQEITLNYSNVTFSSLIGSKIPVASTELVVAGIFKSPFRYAPNPTLYEDEANYIYNIYNTIYLKDTYYGTETNIYSNSLNDKLTININHDGRLSNHQTPKFKAFFDKSDYLIAGQNDFILEDKLNKKEIYITLNDYNKIFSESYIESYYLDEQWVYDPDKDMEIEKIILKNPLIHVGKKINIEVTDKTYSQIDSFEVTIKGVIFKSDTQSLFLIDEEAYSEIVPFITMHQLLISTSTVNNLSQFLRTSVDYYNVEIETPISAPQAHFELTLENIKLIMLLVCILLTFIVLLLTVSLISQSIYARRKEIGILKALGARNKNIYKVYIYENLILCIPIIILSIIFSYLTIWVINYGFVEQYSKDYTFIYYKTYIAFVTVSAILLLNMIGTVIPLYKINMMKPIEAIRK
ncbi:putative ABC transporter, permease/ATP-binding protein [Paracholeplasma brassicae]|uniref:Putative ABC transporter, permease/ATP-binding protein n=1 Tax=Acholeplasma brassicae TaxID=61635 RepID=U4KQ49_9MOLU|nr:ATP-binding cassette domain-containing protein [Paracholeplasma brassicae]CCV66550.1 putative ABC transporter, permease/ATP-binding protein [Paracholeplasma brassicae]